MTNNWVLCDDAVGKDCCVTVCKDATAWERIEPNMIYNRLDLIREEPSELLQVNVNGKMLYIPCCVVDNTAILGIWGTCLSMAQVQAVAQHIFARRSDVVAVSSRRVDLVNAPETFQRVNDFHIVLPDDPAELDQRVSSKMRYNLRREHRLVEKAYGAFSVDECRVEDAEAEHLFEQYFSMKRVTHGREYGMTMDEYIRTYYVSTIYTLRFGGRVAAIVLSCEQAVTKITVSTRKREVKIFFILYLLILRVCDRLHIVLWSICLNSVCKLFVALKAEKHHLNVKQFLVNSKAGTLLVCKESCNSVVIHNF